jgi:hypothetical protein
MWTSKSARYDRSSKLQYPHAARRRALALSADPKSDGRSRRCVISRWPVSAKQQRRKRERSARDQHLIADLEGPTFISRTVTQRRVDRRYL